MNTIKGWIARDKGSISDMEDLRGTFLYVMKPEWDEESAWFKPLDHRKARLWSNLGLLPGQCRKVTLTIHDAPKKEKKARGEK